jgi:hypothetical protein
MTIGQVNSDAMGAVQAPPVRLAQHQYVLQLLGVSALGDDAPDMQSKFAGSGPVSLTLPK